MSTTLLLAGGEHATSPHLQRHLRHDGFEIVNAEASSSAERRPDLVLAGDDAELERWCGEAPVIVLGHVEADSLDRVRAFRRGCDGNSETASLRRSSEHQGLERAAQKRAVYKTRIDEASLAFTRDSMSEID
jgi:hypothetical protein